MSKKQALILIHSLFVLLVLPSILYLVVNGYWWLFDGNNPIGDKMSVAGTVAALGSMLYGFAIAATSDLME